MLDAQPDRYDSTAISYPWRTVAIKPKLRFGVLAEDPIYPLHPPVKKALSDAAKLLKSQGHEVVYLRPEEGRIADAYDVSFKLFSLDSTAARVVAEGGEPPIPSWINLLTAFQKIPNKFVPDLSSFSSWQKLSILNGKRAELADSWRRVWVDHQLDAVLSPVARHTAVEHDTWAIFAYSVLINLLDVSESSRVVSVQTNLA